ncbi:VOC family protein [Catellatospora methionotrophica]|uniref:VOC family protein n=1 Tax=Catellatospora methionotrophica TaxID=121620 RepID=UPI0033F9C90B
MASQLYAVCFDAFRPGELARFYAGVLGRRLADDGVTILPDGDPGYLIRFVPTVEPKTAPNQAHFDLTSTSLEDQRQRVDTALALGGARLDIGQGPDAAHVVLGDPDGNEFDVIEPGNNFLAGCGVLGALACDGTQAVGYFWSAALGWPLVWDQDEETAVQSPHGGTKFTWGGPPVREKTGRNRLHFDLTAPAGDREAEVERLLSLGATRRDGGQCEPGWTALADPDGNEFCLR